MHSRNGIIRLGVIQVPGKPAPPAVIKSPTDYEFVPSSEAVYRQLKTASAYSQVMYQPIPPSKIDFIHKEYQN